MTQTSKEKKIYKTSQERARQASYEDAIKTGHEVKTWSATHTPSHGIQPISSCKICLCCRKKWPVDTDRVKCDCEAQGHLYHMGSYYQKKVGGKLDI